ncbi:MAG TPA: SH3 domain-containing protein [Caldilineaceae bacterium]|nr:SH3 domain-containing protein [Caldilineaceae bacterium]
MLSLLLLLSISTPVLAQSRPATVLTGANLRAGPGTTYAKVGSVRAGQTVQVVASNSDQSWFQLESGAWIAAFLVKLEDAPTPGTPVTPPPGAPATPTQPPPAPPTATPTSTNCHKSYDPCVPIASDVDCLGGRGNGPAYVKGPVRVIGPDVYDLDRDGDGIGCE